MNRLFIVAMGCICASNAMADYSSHQFHYMNIGLSKCKSIVIDAAVKNGFTNPQAQEFTFSGGSYSVVYGTNNDGYSFQYTCEPKKGFGYLIINGSQIDKKNNIRNSLGEEIQNMINKSK